MLQNKIKLLTELSDTETTAEQAEQIAVDLFAYFFAQHQSIPTNLPKDSLFLLVKKLQNLADYSGKAGHELTAVKILSLATQLQNQYDDNKLEEIQKNALRFLILTCTNILEKQETSPDDALLVLCTDIAAKAISNVPLPEDEQTIDNCTILAQHRLMYFVRNFEKKSYELKIQALLCCKTLSPHLVETEALIKLVELRKSVHNGDQNALLSCDEQAIVFINELTTKKYQSSVREFNENLAAQYSDIIKNLLQISTESALEKALRILFILHEKFMEQRLLKYETSDDSDSDSDKASTPKSESKLSLRNDELGGSFLASLDFASLIIRQSKYAIIAKNLAYYTKKFEPLMCSFASLETEYSENITRTQSFIDVFYIIILLNFENKEWKTLPSLIKAMCLGSFLRNKTYLHEVLKMCTELVMTVYMNNKGAIPALDYSFIPTLYDSFKKILTHAEICILEPAFVKEIFSVFVDLKASAFAACLIVELTKTIREQQGEYNHEFDALPVIMSEQFITTFSTPKLEQKSDNSPCLAGMFSTRVKRQPNTSDDVEDTDKPPQKKQCSENTPTITARQAH
jgi:hypothetical protein